MENLPAVRVLARKSFGRELALVDKFIKQFRDEESMILDPACPDRVSRALGYLFFYPVFLEYIGHDPGAEPARWTARNELDHIHILATEAVMAEAERLGMDSGPIWEFSRVCRELLREKPWEYYHDFDLWPDCLGPIRGTLPIDYREAIRQGEMAVRRLGVRLDLAKLAPVADDEIEPGEAIAMLQVECRKRFGRDLPDRKARGILEKPDGKECVVKSIKTGKKTRSWYSRRKIRELCVGIGNLIQLDGLDEGEPSEDEIESRKAEIQNLHRRNR